MKIFDKFVSVLLSLLLSFFGALVIVITIISSTIGNPKFMIRVLENRNYYDSIYLEYCDEIEALAIPAGVPEGVFSSIISKQEFKNDVDIFINNAYNNTHEYAGVHIDNSNNYDKFYKSMVAVAEDKGVAIDEDLKDGLDNVASICASTYKVFVEVPLVDTIGSYSDIFSKYFKLGFIICGVFVVLFIVLVLITPKWRRNFEKIFSLMFVTDGLFLLLAPTIVLLSGKIRYLKINTRSLYDFAVGYLEHTLETFIFVGLGLVLVPVVYYLVKYYRQKLKTQ